MRVGVVRSVAPGVCSKFALVRTCAVETHVAPHDHGSNDLIRSFRPCPWVRVGYNGRGRSFHAFVVRGKGVRLAYFDCFSGIAGDMTLAALVDAGVDRKAIQEAVASLGLPCELTFENVRRGGFRATYAKVVAPHEHVHRHWHHIEAIIDKSSLTARQKDLAKRIFLKLGEAEASVHGIDLSKIHFHEVGAVDSIVDIVGSAVGLDLLGVDRFEASPVPTGRGWVKAAHGRMPLPAPATAELLRGVPLAESMVDMELTTPTGAAILTTVVERFTSFPALTIESIGLGRARVSFPSRRISFACLSGPHNCRPRATGSGSWKPISTIFPARSSATR